MQGSGIESRVIPAQHQAITPSIRPSSIACFGLRKLSRSARAKRAGGHFESAVCASKSPPATA